MIRSLSTDLKGQIDTVCMDLMAKTEPVSASCAAHETRLTSLEDATNQYSDRVVDLENQTLLLKEDVGNLNQKTEDLEGTQHWCNMPI